MAPPPLSWQLRLSALCHLTMLLAGQHSGVKKCTTVCDVMHPKIPLERLISYQQSQPSCSKQAIIFKTIKNRLVCTDPNEEWVQKAMKQLDRKADGIPEKLTDRRRPRIPLDAPGMNSSAVSEPKAARENSSQETLTALGTSPELPTTLAGSWRPTFLDGQPPTGPETTKLYNSVAVTTTTSWQSSAASQPGWVLWTERKTSEVTPTQAPSTQTLPTQTRPTQTPTTQAPSTQTLSTQAPSTQTHPTQALSTQAPSTQAPSTQTLPPQAPSTQTPSTQTLPTQAPIISHTAPEDSTDDQNVTRRQTPMTEYYSLKPRETDPTSAYSLQLTAVSSEGALSTEPVTSGNCASNSPRLDDPQPRRQAVGLLAFLGLLFGLGVAMFAYQSLQSCNFAGDMVEGLRYVPRSCGSNSYVLVPV